MTSKIHCGQKVLVVDEACLRIHTSEHVSLSSQLNECYKCDLIPVEDFSGTSELIFGTVYPTELLLSNEHGNCSLSYHFAQHGVYGLNVTNTGSLNCSHIFPISPADDVYRPLWILLWISLVSMIICAMIISVGHLKALVRFIRTNPAFRELQNDIGQPSDGTILVSDFTPSSPLPTSPFRHRVKAVDTFRGITIVLMIFVNSGGGKYSIFQHSPWNGLTLADVIFPWFIWIMGFSMVMSIKNHIRAERRKKQLFLSAVQRCLTLFALGIVLNSLTTIDLNNMRLPGVLQRIAVTYFIISSLQICFVTPEYVAVGNSFVDKLSDILSCWVQWLVILGLIGVHSYLSLGVPYENCPPGYLGPGGLSDSSLYFNCTGGFASYLDRIVFGTKHMYTHSTPQLIYQTTIPVDPEGLLGTLTCCFCAFLGVQAGQILLSFYNPKKRMSRWLFWSALTGLAGGCLCEFSVQGGPIPINKNLWSLSFCLVTSSLAFLILLVLYLLIDHWMIWNGAPFIQTGRNSILLYFCSCVLGKLFPFCWKPLVDDTTHSEYLFMNTFGTLLWIIIACILARNKVYVTV